MSRDIRSFFCPVSRKQNHTTTSVKRPLINLDSSDEEVIETTPVAIKNTNKEIKWKKRKRGIIDSDSDDGDKKKENSSKNDNIKRGKNTKLQKVNAADVFGSIPISQAKVEKPKVNTAVVDDRKSIEKNKNSKPKLETEIGIHDDPDFEQSLLDLDNDMLLDNVNILDKTIEEALNNTSAMSTSKKPEATPKRKRNISEVEDTGIDKDQERYEKKRHSAMLYQKYLNRSGPVHHGAKEYPKGKPGCLSGLCFLRTGVLDSLEGEEFVEIVTKYGGRTVNSVSRKVNYIVAGDEAGPAKLEKARSLGIPTITEDEFLDLILTKSGMRPKYAANGSVSEDKEEKYTPKDETKHADPKKHIEKTVSKDIKTEASSSNKNIQKSAVTKDIKKENHHQESSSSKKNSSNNLPEITIKKENFYNVTNKKSDENTPNTDRQEIATPAVINENLSWADKYKPRDIKAIIGQQGDRSCMKKLLHWLSKWYDNHSGKNKQKLAKPSPWNKSDDGAYFKCALLSGPPGIGKTTTATLVAKELGFDIVEFNASDTRSKRLLHEEVSQLLSTNSLAGFLKDGSAPTKKHVLLMDEVDGMAGNEDRGGMQELIQLIKNSNIPIICMCNDRNHPKVRSLANYCFDLRVPRPRLEQIRGAMMSVCFKENLKMKPDALTEIINGTGMDVRQTLNHLSMWTVNNKSLSLEEAHKEATSAQKDTILGPWEVVRKVFSEEEHKKMSVADKFRLFFYDYSIGPLFVQENYLQVQPHCPKKEILEKVFLTADAISKSDLIEKKIRSRNNWSLLEVQAIYSSVLPGHYMEGHMRGQINFPGWLGKNSKKGKFKRLVSELQAHMRISTSGSRRSVNLDYVYHLRNGIVKPLADEGVNGIEKSLEVMHSYNLLREDLDGIIEVSHWARQKDPMAMVDSKVKAAFTRAYNKDGAKLPYSVSSATVKKKVSSALEENPYDEEDVESAPEDDDDITKDAMIKAKKKAVKAKTNAEASTSKKTGNTTKGKGNKKNK